MTQPDPAYVKWLEARAMLKASQERASLYSGQSRLWQQPYAEAQPRRATEIASVWLTVYPDAIIAPEGCSVLGALGWWPYALPPRKPGGRCSVLGAHIYR